MTDTYYLETTLRTRSTDDVLHITCGESNVITLRQQSVEGELLSWIDVLHEGPVPPGLTLEELSHVRVNWLASAYPATLEQARREFGLRDRTIQRHTGRVSLWFEKDLFDQLQLIQILDYYSRHPVPELNLVTIDHADLGRLIELWPTRVPVTAEMMQLAVEAWKAFRSPDPRDIQALLATDTGALPHLGPALRRYLEQFPWTTNGCNRTENQILRAADQGVCTRAALFELNQVADGLPFMGDLTFFDYLDRLIAGGLLTSEYALSPLGDTVLAGRRDWLEIHPHERWMGGCLASMGRWNPVTERIEHTALN